MRKGHSYFASGHTIAGAFVLLQLGLFALLSTMLVLLGVQGYRNSVARSEKISGDRILASYVRSMVRAQDERGGVTVENDDTVCISYEYEGTRYVTRIYVYEDRLREWFADESYDFRPEDGEEICEAQSLHAEIENGLLQVEAVDAQGDTVRTQIALRAGSV